MEPVSERRWLREFVHVSIDGLKGEWRAIDAKSKRDEKVDQSTLHQWKKVE